MLLIMALKKTNKTNSTTLMDHQDTISRGDSKAVRTERITFATTPEIVDAITDAAYEKRVSRSKLIEAAIVEFLGL